MIEHRKATTLMSAPWPAMPLEASLIREGVPDPKGFVAAQSSDRRLSCGVWLCHPGRFDFEYEWDEFAYVLEGEVEIREDDGDLYRIGAGDIVHFPSGTKTHWNVLKTVRKVFFLKTTAPLTT